ncbi:MAG: phenylalanine--tRNA ligase subunit beta [Nanoarchaeota archaeon]|nr:phenylalanine--tRNA ligase subunit beta [Nanoarchaeota archaeon]
MPTITLDKKDVFELIGKKLPDDELKDRISMLGTDLDSVDDKEIIVEVFPNRPDLLSEEGFSRALSSFIGVKTGLRKYDVKKSNFKVKVEKSVENVRPFIRCAVLKNINLSDEAIKSLMQLQEKLHLTHGRKRKKVAIGVHDFNAIKFPLVYKAVKPDSISFVPLDMTTEMNLAQILSKHPKGRDYAFCLEGLEKYPIIIDAKNDVVSFPPIINGIVTQVKENTKNLFIDVTGLDINAVTQALNILVASLADRGAEVYSLDVDGVVSPDLKPRKMKVNLDYVNKLLGLNLNKEKFVELIEKMGLGFDKDVLIPAYRDDIIHPVDIVEAVAIAYGFENFEPEIPNLATIAEENSFEKFKSKIAEILVGLGIIETNTYHITNKENLNKKMNLDLGCVELSNALTKDYDVLRSWMIPSLMDVLKNNKNREFPQKIFEMGVCFKENKEKETGVEEFTRLAVLISHTKANFTEIKQVLDYLFNLLGLEYKTEDTEHSSFIKGRVGRVIVNGKKLAYIGEISPEVITNWELEMPVAALELNLTELFELIK